jgi:two-component system response regulator YesN
MYLTKELGSGILYKLVSILKKCRSISVHATLLKRLLKKNIFYTFFLSYLIILCISLAVVSFIYTNVVNVVENDVKEANLSLLEQCKDIIDQRMAEIDRIIVQLSMNDKINSLMRAPGIFKGDEYFKLWELSRQLLTYSSSNDFVKNLFLYFENSDVIISPYWGSDRINSFYDIVYKSNNKMDYGKWYQLIRSNNKKIVLPSSMIRITNEEKLMLTYISGLIFDSPVNSFCKTIIFIEDSQITRLMERIDLKGGGWLSVFDASGKSLINVGNIPGEESYSYLPESCFQTDRGFFEHGIQEEDMFITYTKSAYNQWVYTAAVPKDVIMGKVANIKRIIIFIAFLYLAVGLLTAFFLSYRNAKPIINLISNIRNIFSDGFQTGKNEYEVIQSTISQVINKNKQLSRVIETQKPLLKTAFINRLLSGGFINQAELNAYMLNAGIDLKNYGKFLTVISQIAGYGEIIDASILEELNKVRAIINNIENENQLFSYSLNEKTIVLIFGYNASIPNEDIRSISETTIKQLNDILVSKFNIRCHFACGDICNAILDIYDSFNKANIALESIAGFQGMKQDLTIKWYEEIPNNKIKTCFYPDELELRIRNLVKSGETLELEKVLQFIYYENYVKRKLEKDELSILLEQICSTYNRVKNSLKLYLEPDYGENAINVTRFSSIKNKTEAFFKIRQKILELCKKAADKRKEQSNELSRKILEYIENNFSDPSFSLQVMADDFGLSAVYMSRFFKKHTGESFSTYLEKVRIKNATEMLKLQKYSVNTISQMVGYNSAMSFRRAFKRVMGTNPTDYKYENIKI